MIAVLLAHPEYASAVSAALERLGPAERLTLQLFYTAAVLLQQEYAGRLQHFVDGHRLPDRFSAELEVPESAESVAQHLLRSWELEARWKQ